MRKWLAGFCGAEKNIQRSVFKEWPSTYRSASLLREHHLIIYGDIAFRDIIQLSFHQLSLQRRHVVDEKLAFDVVVLMQDDAGGNAIKGFFVVAEFLVLVFDRYFFCTIYVFPDLGNAEAAFIVGPVVPMLLHNMRIDK